MAVKRTRIEQKQADGSWLILHPETEACITLYKDSNVEYALDELNRKVEDIEGGSVTSVNGIGGEVIIEGGNNINVISSNDGRIKVSAPEVATSAALSAVSLDLASHKASKANPHNVTKEQLGLSNVNNTSDLDKPVSNATRLELDGKQALITDNNKLPMSLVSGIAEELDKKVSGVNSDSTGIIIGGDGKNVSIGLKIASSANVELAQGEQGLVATVKENIFDAAGSADAALGNAKEYTDAEIDQVNADIEALSGDVYHKAEIKDIALTGKATDVSSDEYGTGEEKMPAGTVQSSLEFLYRAIGSGGTGSTVEVIKQATPEAGFLSTYYVTQGGVRAGEKINIPSTDVAQEAEKIKLTKTNGIISADVVAGSLEKEDLTADLQSEIEGKQEKLTAGTGFKIENNVLNYDPDVLSTVDYVDGSISDTIAWVDQQDAAEHAGRVAGDNLLQERKQNKLIAGDNIEIDESTNVIKAIVPEVVTPEAIVVTKEVGGYHKGDEIPEGTALFEIIKQILQPAIPVGQTFLYWATKSEIPTAIDDTWNKEESTESISASYVDHYFNPTGKQHLCFAFKKKLGDLVYIDQLIQGEPSGFGNLLDDFNKYNVIYDGEEHIMYVAKEKSLTQDDGYRFFWVK